MEPQNVVIHKTPANMETCLLWHDFCTDIYNLFSLQLSFQRKVGVMYCMSGQSSEEEMYNNESAGPALEEFLHLLGERVRLKGFTKYRAQLDSKSMYTPRKHGFLGLQWSNMQMMLLLTAS